MINVERVDRILSRLALTGLVKNGRGLISATLIAPSDAGKSELLLRNQPAGARVINDFTFGSLVPIVADPKPPKWIVVPDLNQAMSHKPAVANLTMAFLLPLLGEGVTEIPGLDGHAKVRTALRRAKGRGITIGLLTAMTPEMFFSKRGKWKETGLLRRLIPIYYSYSVESQVEIQTLIRKGEDRLTYTHGSIRSRGKAIDVTIPERLERPIERLSEQVSDQLSFRSKGGRTVQAIEFPFSIHKTLRTYVRACALQDSRSACTEADFAATEDFARFIRYDRPERL